MDDFFLDIWHTSDTTRIVCKGELDISTSGKLRDALSIAYDHSPARIELDCNGVSLLSAAGITVLVEAVLDSKERGIELGLELSTQARRVLDVVGLWWLGIVEDGVAVEEALGDALRLYADTARELQTSEIETTGR